MIYQGSTEDSGNARANIPNASKERNLRETSGYSRDLFECILGTQGFWRVASSNRLKTTECPHRHTSHSHAHYKLGAVERGDYPFKTDLQDAYFHVLRNSRQQEVPSFCLQKQGISILSTSLWSQHCRSGIYSSGAHSGSLPPPSGDINNSISR